jgi:sugar (pentulose or hexulose) kinase
LILTVDLGTSTTKAVVWDADGPRAVGRAALDTTFPAGDRAEQDPATWWPSVVAAAAAARDAAAGSFAHVDAVGFSAARQTVACVTGSGETLGPALVWSDRRAPAEADVLARELGGSDAVRARTGGVLDGAAVAAKAAWLAAHDGGRWRDCRWLLTPRDLVVWRMTGEVATDPTMLSAAGLTDSSGALVPGLAAALGDRLPPVLAPDAVAGVLAAGPAADLGLRAGVPVVMGAGDRACEVLGTAATPDRPMVSWGTTANVSIPVADWPVPVPAALSVTRAASGGWLLEGGLSAAGSLLAWLSTLTGRDIDALAAAATASPIGARGVVALPWFGGARAPWWRPTARGAFTGLSFDHDPGDLARACLESVAREVGRCLDGAGAAAGGATSLALTGTEATTMPWVEILTGVTGLPAVRRRSGQAASAGAALLASRAVGAGFDLDRLDPVGETVVPDPRAVARYAELGRRAETTAEAVVWLDGPDGEGAGA